MISSPGLAMSHAYHTLVPKQRRVVSAAHIHLPQHLPTTPAASACRRVVKVGGPYEANTRFECCRA